MERVLTLVPGHCLQILLRSQVGCSLAEFLLSSGLPLFLDSSLFYTYIRLVILKINKKNAICLKALQSRRKSKHK